MSILRPIEAKSQAAGRGQDVARGRRVALSRLTGLALVLAVVLMLGAWGGLRARAGYAAYQSAWEQVAELSAYQEVDPETLTVEDARSAHQRFAALRRDIERLRAVASLPLGIDQHAGALPLLGERYTAARDTLDYAWLLARAGEQGSEVGLAVLEAYETTGVSSDGPPAGDTWLDVLVANEAKLFEVATMIEDASALRARIDESQLPAKVGARISAADGLLLDVDARRWLEEEYPAVVQALGGKVPVTYLVLFQNPAELRPSGGFPGTVALITLDRGQLRGYDFEDIHDLTLAYLEQSRQRRPQPWVLHQYAPLDEHMIHDAHWWADFARSSEEMLAMYADTDWPPIDGIVAVEPSVVSGLLELTGPIEIVTANGPIEVNTENVHDQIERQRGAEPVGGEIEDTHKSVLALVGRELIDRLRDADRETAVAAAYSLLDSAARRELQAYSRHAEVQQALDARAWSGQLIPDPAQPTLAVTFANVAFGKSSLRMLPAYDLLFHAPDGGRQRVTMTISMEHTGTEAEDPFYAGFQRWWIEVVLPDGARMLATEPDPAPNPDLPDGTSFAIELHPQETRSLSFSFVMPADGELRLRRQSGLNSPAVTIHGPGCVAPSRTTLDTDLIVSLRAPCEPAAGGPDRE